MALVNQWILYIGIPVVLVLALLRLQKKQKYRDGKKIANASILEETPYFKKLYREYKVLSWIAFIAVLMTILLSWVLLARPARIDVITPEIRNRDIFLCMDISDSVDELNLKMCDELKKVVEALDGERFGITIFNGQSVLLVPLTTDYQYVMNTLDSLKESFVRNIDRSNWSVDDILSKTDWTVDNYKYSGTLAEEGSSFIGDGLASALYSFPDLEENKERSRMIIFTTDNQLNGVPYVTLEQATDLCKRNDVKVFAIAPKDVTDEAVFKYAIESTGGGYYRGTSSKEYERLIEDIKKTDLSQTGVQQAQTVISDQPRTIFIWILICLGVYLFICKKIKV